MTTVTRPTPAASLRAAERVALVVAAVGIAASAAGIFVEGREAFFRAYLVAVMLWIEVAFGCLGIQMLHVLSGGGWGQLIRRPIHAASSTMPLCFALFAPLLLGLSTLYPWARPEEVAADALLQHKAPYLNAPFFVARAVAYFALWSAIAFVLFRQARRRRGGVGKGVVAGPGILACGLTMTFASMDWMMSLDPHWYSTMFGAIVVVGSLLGGMAFSIVAVVTETPEGELPLDRLHDLGNLLLVFTMLWAYLSFSQYLIIYAGNTAEDVPFYVYRTERGWEQIARALIVLHFAVPFTVLLTRRTKRSPRALRAVAVGMLIMRVVELFWFIAPSVGGHELRVGLLDVAAPVGVGGIWVLWFMRRMRAFSAPVTPASSAVAAGGAT
jgi:hypothetical protein